MATSRNFGQLAKRLKIRAEEFGRNTENAIKRAALAADTEAVTRTPVDTGRAKGNWLVAVGAPNLRPIAIGGGASAGNAALEQGRATIGKWKLGNGTIYINNNLAYIVPLDNGSSANAPQGMSQFAIQAARRELKKAKLLK